MTWLGMIPTRLKWAIAGGAIVIIVALGLVQWGKSEQRAEQAAQDAQDYIGGTQDARDSVSNLPDDPVDGLLSVPF